jgi:hypothetical protein
MRNKDGLGRQHTLSLYRKSWEKFLIKHRYPSQKKMYRTDFPCRHLLNA